MLRRDALERYMLALISAGRTDTTLDDALDRFDEWLVSEAADPLQGMDPEQFELRQALGVL